MPSTPYRTPSPDQPTPEPERPPYPVDVAIVAALSWVLALLRVAYGVAREKSANADFAIASVALVVAPIVIWKEIEERYHARARRGAERVPRKASNDDSASRPER